MRRFVLIGHPLGHSASAVYFTEKFAREALAECEYSLCDLAAVEELPQLLERNPDIEGLNVTIPYKRAVMPYLASVSPEAAAIGAVNCIRRTAEGLHGYNTDIVGLRRSLDELLGAEVIESALVLGTGGASQAVQYALMEREIPYEIVSRDALRGNYTYDTLPCEVVEQSRLIINATPVGTYPAVDVAPRIPYAYITPRHYLLDLVYNPEVTQFLDFGRQRGARTMNGRVMFTAQAEASWSIWNR